MTDNDDQTPEQFAEHKLQDIKTCKSNKMMCIYAVVW